MDAEQDLARAAQVHLYECGWQVVEELRQALARNPRRLAVVIASLSPEERATIRRVVGQVNSAGAGD